MEKFERKKAVYDEKIEDKMYKIINFTFTTWRKINENY